MEPPDALPEMPVLRGPYLLERRTASTGLDPDSTKLAVEVDVVGAMVLQPSSPCASQQFERSVQRAPQIAPGCSVQRRRPRLTFGMGSLMDEGGRPCHACHRIVQRAAPAASHASVAMPARGQHEGCQHERWAPLSQQLAGRGHAGRPAAPRLRGRTRISNRTFRNWTNLNWTNLGNPSLALCCEQSGNQQLSGSPGAGVLPATNHWGGSAEAPRG